MRSFLLDALFKGKATIAPPGPDAVALEQATRASASGRDGDSAVRSPSARSTPARAMAANSKSTPSAIRFTTSSGSA
jgi:hypothetical protein